ncbi:TOBE domain-containing protein [Azorhizophilus paspali]|uniref:Molybdopterin-binding protein n=1 Tax=Azorhizophilus paspali TaxID=69963 RepID=A0ABV6SR60_AZOPA
MRVSARNVLEGTVSTLKEGAVNAEVDVTLDGGDTLVAVVTLESARSLGLVAGKKVVAVIKAPWVLLAVDDRNGCRLSARNVLAGTIESIEVGTVNVEVILTLPGGTKIVSVVTKEAAAELGLKPGASASAVIKASSVILGVPV